jgi:hypothetical protein
MKKNIQQVYEADCRWAAQLGCHREQRGRYELAFYRTFFENVSMLPLSKSHPSFDFSVDLFRPFFSFKR